MLLYVGCKFGPQLLWISHPHKAMHSARKQTALTLCVSDCVRTCVCVCVCVSLRPARQTHCEVFLPFFSHSSSLPRSFLPFLLSPSFHPSVSPSLFKGGPSLPSSQHPLNLSVHSSLYPSNQSVHLYPGIITTANPSHLFSAFPFLLD